ncbi:solute carrier family 22 member 6 [Lampris incognitus]|uniref:solute carrier family 22 member 6 n=1 Tax=Lampris incognitus TaxID=2546036 RepID=UPI0024B55A4F|nr:solute carrier family 22 member 6 [Lampris incognitus]
MAPLQLAVLWRLSVIFFLSSFLFFLDVFTVSSDRCPPGDTNSSESDLYDLQSAPWNQSRTQSVCVWGGWMSHGQTLYMTGLLLGSLCGGALSDWYGRRVVLLVCVSVHAVCGVIPAALHHPLLFLTLRCLTGVCCCCINICSFSLGVEWSLPQYRVWPPALLAFSFSLGMMALAPVAYACSSWTQLHLAVGLPQVLTLPVCISVPESPRWLALKHKAKVLDCYRNHSPADKHCLDLLLDRDKTGVKEDTERGEEPSHPKGHTFCDVILLRHPTVLLRLAIMSYLGLVSALTYYGICLNIGSFGVNVYAAQFFSGLSEAPCLLVPFLLARWGRRPMSMLALFLSGMACLMSLLVSRFYDQPMLVMSLALLGKFCMLTTVFVSLLYGIELFPTMVRQRCVALVNLCFRIGCLFNSLVSATQGIPLAAMIVYSCGPIIGCGLCVFLPETSGEPLPDSVEDCDRQPTLRLLSLTTTWKRWLSVDDHAAKPEVPSGEKELAQTGKALLTDTQTPCT